MLDSKRVWTRYDAWDLERGAEASRRSCGSRAASRGTSSAARSPARGVQRAVSPEVFDPRAILRVLAEHGVEFVVVGGVAVQTHGYLRPTRDLDIIPRPDLVNLSRLGEALAELGSRLHRTQRPVDITDPQILKRAALVPLVTTYGRLDVINVESAAGRLWAVLRASGASDRRGPRHLSGRRRGPRRPDQDEEGSGARAGSDRHWGPDGARRGPCPRVRRVNIGPTWTSTFSFSAPPARRRARAAACPPRSSGAGATGC